MARAQPRVDGEQELLLALVRRARHEDRRARVEPHLRAQRLLAPRPAVEHERVELGVPGDPDAVGRGAEGEHALGLLVRAHEEAVDAPERVRDGAEERAVARHLRGVEAAVRERDAHARLARGADEVRPDLGVLEHEEVRAQRRDGAAGRAEEVVGRVER